MAPRQFSGFPDAWTGGAVEAGLEDRVAFGIRLNAFGEDTELDAVRKRHESAQECLVAGVALQILDKAGVHLEVIKSQIIDAAELAKLAPAMFDTEGATKSLQPRE